MASKSRLEQLEKHLGSDVKLNPLDEERLNITFPVKELTYFLDGSKEITEQKQQIMLEFERDPLWKINDSPNLTLEETRERSMSKAKGVISSITTQSLKLFTLKMSVISYVDPGFYTRIGVHLGLFLGALRGQATPKQLAYWLEKGAVAMNGVIGCFAMTELGHGSNVAGLETIATFDEASDEFVIHTPTLTATKWWIGGAAHTATHAAVYAQLIVKNKRYGVKCFVVPLRDSRTYDFMTGVIIGDCGKKMGRDGIDNGYIQFNKVRIPRQYMLMKHTQVSRTGEVTEPPLNQLAFGALIGGRVGMISESADFSAKALTIAIRYAAVRRQFSSANNKTKSDKTVETKIIDYPIHQHRLFPLLALTMAINFTAKMITKKNNRLRKQMDNFKGGDKQQERKLLASLNEVHSTSAGLKAFGTWNCLDVIEKCRQACGGHGYSAYTGLSSMYQDFAVQCSWEGDNTILTLQLGRYLIKNYLNIKQGKMKEDDNIPAGIEYLKYCFEDKSTHKVKDFELRSLAKAWDLVAANSVRLASEAYIVAYNETKSKELSHEKCSIQRYRASKCHYQRTLLNEFINALESSPLNLKAILTKVCYLFACYSITENAGEFMKAGCFEEPQMEVIQTKVTELCLSLRPEIVGLTDAFGFTDYVINSPLGRYDGHVYKAYFDLVNANNKNNTKRAPYFKRLIRPLLTSKYDEDNSFEIEIDEE